MELLIKSLAKGRQSSRYIENLRYKIYRKGVSRFPTQPRNFFQPERFFHISGVSKVLFFLSLSNMLFNWFVVEGSKMKALVS